MRGRGGWATLALSVATYAVVSIAMHQPFHVGAMRLRDFDLRIYRLGALRLIHGSSLYGTPMVDDLGFTYPPFAALLLAPLAWLPWSVDTLAVTGLNVLLLVARFIGTAQPAGAWELLVVAVVASGLMLAVRASRRGDEASGFSLAALSTLLASPISWSHHWTLAVPALILLARRSYERRSRALGTAVAILGLAGYAYLPEIAESDFRSARGATSLLITDPYPLVAVLVLAACAVPLARTSLRALTPPAGVRRTSRPRATISTQSPEPGLR